MAASYHLSLVFNGTNLWSQPDDASRLTARAPVTAPFSVTSCSFSPNPITVGQATTASLTFSGGSAGTYTLVVWRDISLWPDEQLTTYSVVHNGGTTTKTFSFTPPTVASYHLSLVFNGTNMWSQPDDASRLTARAPVTAPFSVTSCSFSPNPITVGQATTASITFSGGSAGTCTLVVWRDISLWPDEQLTTYSVVHNGGTTTKTFSFTPPTVASYHLSLVFNGTNIWSQPNDASRLKATQVPPTVKIEGSDIPSVLLVGHPYRYNVTLNNRSPYQATLSLTVDSSTNGRLSAIPVTLLPNTTTKIPVTSTFMPTGLTTLTFGAVFGSSVIDRLAINIDVKTAVVSSPNWRENIRPGDILLSRSGSFLSVIQAWLGNFWTHAGIYVGNGKVVEALGEGVSVTDITSWDYNAGSEKSKSCVGLLRVSGTDATKADVAVKFAESQVGKPYLVPIPLLVSKTADPNATAWYCSELVWAAYKHVGIDIEYTPDSWLVFPQELDDDEDTESVALHVESVPGPDTLIPPSFLILHLHSPADLVVTDPDGLVVTFDQNQVADSMYIVDDFDGNGDPEAIVGIPSAKTGEYRVDVTPKEGTSPTDTYSLEAGVAGQRAWLANDMPMSSIPTQGFALTVGVPPAAVTGSASSIGSSSAVLHCDLTSIGTASTATVSFQWGTMSQKYTDETPAKVISGAGIVSIDLQGLSPNSKYYCRAKAVGVGTTYGAEFSFTTLQTTGQTTGAGEPIASSSESPGAGSTSDMPSSFAALPTSSTPGQPIQPPADQRSVPTFSMVIIVVLAISLAAAIAGIVVLATRRRKDTAN